MNKIAQRRGIFNKIRETVNAPGEALSGVFSPEFTRLMDTLREVDDEAREHAVDLKDMLKVARSSFNRREYMSAISYLGKFHERLELVRYQFIKLSKEADMVHNEFLFGDLDEEHKKNLFEKMPERHKAKPKPAAKKEAGVKDWWHNLTSDRGRALKYWEKRFPRAAKEIKRQTEKMLNRSEMFLNVLQSTFKTLATFRATRKLEDYIKVSNGWVDKYNAYDGAFNEYFNGSVRKFIESQKEFEAKKQEREAEIEARRTAPLGGETSGEAPGSVPGEVSPDSEADRPTGEFQKAKPTEPKPESGGGGTLLDPEQQEKSEVEKAIQEELDGPGSWPKRKVENPLTLRDPETKRDSIFEPNDSEILSDPSTPRPSSGNRVRALPPALPTAGSEPTPITQNQGPMASIWEEDPARSIVLTDPEAQPHTPTMRSPVAPPSPPVSPAPVHQSMIPGPNSVSPGSIYDRPIPRAGKVPSLSDLAKPPTQSQLGRFMYYTPPVAPAPGSATVRPGAKPVTHTVPGVGMEGAPPVQPKPNLQLLSQPPSTKGYGTASEFIESLTKLSDQNPLVLAREIIVFANSIADTNKETSERLLKIAKQLIKQ